MYRQAPTHLPVAAQVVDAAEERRLLLPLLDNLHIANPCPQSWEEMEGDERVRFCWRCEKNVYNLTAMTREEAEQLVFAREGQMCARFYRRADGTILTADCPPGRRRKRRLRSLLAGAVAALLAALGMQHEPPPAPRRLPVLPERAHVYGGWGAGSIGWREPRRSPVTGFEILDRRVDGWTESWMPEAPKARKGSRD
jgi:hypothetical protein